MSEETDISGKPPVENDATVATNETSTETTAENVDQINSNLIPHDNPSEQKEAPLIESANAETSQTDNSNSNAEVPVIEKPTTNGVINHFSIESLTASIEPSAEKQAVVEKVAEAALAANITGNEELQAPVATDTITENLETSEGKSTMETDTVISETHNNEDDSAKPAAEKRNASCVDEIEESASKKIKTSEPCEKSDDASSNCEVTSSSKAKESEDIAGENDVGKVADEAKTVDNAQDKEKSNDENEKTETSEKESEKEGKDGDEPMEDTATKLLASGISISLIKKKGGEQGESSTEPDETDKPKTTTTDESENGTSPLDVGPNISVTMINKSSTPAATPPATDSSTTSSSSSGSAKFTLSLKSQSELIDPKKSDTSNNPNIVSSGGASSVSDSISVSKINRPYLPSSPAAAVAGSNNAAKAIITSKQSSLPSPGSLIRSGVTPNGMPGLHPRPFLRASSAGSSNQSLASAGPVSEQLNLVAGGIAEYMRHGIEEILRELSAQGSAEATIKGLQLEMERIKWRHQQELSEVKANIDNMIKDLKLKMTTESQRTIEEYKKQAEIERQKAILETKKKQWCAQCGKEAIFYCCWNTSYCDYPCQQSHWPSHMTTCAQTNNEEESQDQKPATHQVQQVQHQQQTPTSVSLMNSMGGRPGVPGLPGHSMGMGGDVLNPNGMSSYMMGGMGAMNMRPTSQSMMRGNPMGVNMRPGVPGQLAMSRPYFM